MPTTEEWKIKFSRDAVGRYYGRPFYGSGRLVEPERIPRRGESFYIRGIFHLYDIAMEMVCYVSLEPAEVFTFRQPALGFTSGLVTVLTRVRDLRDDFLRYTSTSGRERVPDPDRVQQVNILAARSTRDALCRGEDLRSHYPFLMEGVRTEDEDLDWMRH